MNYLFVILLLTNFLKTVGIIILIYFVLRFVGRLLFPIIVKKAVNNMQARQTTYAHRKEEGEVTVEKKQGQQGRRQNSEGEYVDFEEVD